MPNFRDFVLSLNCAKTMRKNHVSAFCLSLPGSGKGDDVGRGVRRERKRREGKERGREGRAKRGEREVGGINPSVVQGTLTGEREVLNHSSLTQLQCTFPKPEGM